jgi:hypothetical protein
MGDIRVNGMAAEAQVIEPIAGSMPASIAAGRVPHGGVEIARARPPCGPCMPGSAGMCELAAQ